MPLCYKELLKMNASMKDLEKTDTIYSLENHAFSNIGLITQRYKAEFANLRNQQIYSVSKIPEEKNRT